MTLDEITGKLKGMLSEKRFRHSLSVQEMAVKLAKAYGGDEEKAALAGLIHDCAKSKPDEELLKLAGEFGILVDNIQKAEPGLLHAVVGAELAKRYFGIEDGEILDAVRYHTTGCEDMALMTRIIYTADYIAQDRQFPGVEDLRKTAFENLDAAVLMGLDLTIKHVLSKNGLIHPDTVNARNFMIITFPDWITENIVCCN